MQISDEARGSVDSKEGGREGGTRGEKEGRGGGRRSRGGGAGGEYTGVGLAEEVLEMRQMEVCGRKRKSKKMD